MTQKFGRTFRLTIDPRDGLPAIVVTLPFSVQFTMKRDVAASLNNLTIDVYNLSEENRRRIFQDRWDLREVTLNGKPQGRRIIRFEIGYATLYKVYEGFIQAASSAREGVDIITRLEALSGEFDLAASQTFLTLAAGVTQADVLKTLVGQLPTLQLGKIGSWPTVFNRPVVLNGNTWDLIKLYSDQKAFIDNGSVYILQDNEALKIEIPIIDVSTGLLETPRREQTSLILTTLLEANLQIGQLVNVASTIEPTYDGQYKLMGLQHAGIISGAFSGDARTVLFLQAATFFSYTQR